MSFSMFATYETTFLADSDKQETFPLPKPLLTNFKLLSKVAEKSHFEITCGVQNGACGPEKQPLSYLFRLTEGF